MVTTVFIMLAFPLGIITGLIYTYYSEYDALKARNEIKKYTIELYKAIAHGDDEHRQWLADKMYEFYKLRVDSKSCPCEFGKPFYPCDNCECGG